MGNISQLKNRIDIFVKFSVQNTFGKLRDWLVRILDAGDVKNSEIMVVFRAKSDDNGALSFFSLTNMIKLHRGIKVVYKDVSSIREINDTIDYLVEKGNIIKGFMLDAHGNPYSIGLGDERIWNVGHRNSQTGPFEERNIDQLAIGLEKIAKDAVIILKSCSTGYVDMVNNLPSIAQRISLFAPGRMVFAPIFDANMMAMNLTWKDKTNDPSQGKILDITFKTCKSIREGSLKNRIANVFSNIVWIVSHGFFGGEDMTARVLNYDPNCRSV